MKKHMKSLASSVPTEVFSFFFLFSPFIFFFIGDGVPTDKHMEKLGFKCT
jgi:hypothetical protein